MPRADTALTASAAGASVMGASVMGAGGSGAATVSIGRPSRSSPWRRARGVSSRSRARAASPARPDGISQSTNSTPMPAATRRIVASRSCRPRMPAAPAIAPPIEPRPPMVAIEKISTDCTGWYEPTRAPCRTRTCRPPARPASRPENTNPLRVTDRVDTDAASLAFALSRAAISRRPERERRTPRASAMPSASTARQNQSMERSCSRSTRPHSRGRSTSWGISSGNTLGLST